MRCQKSVTWKSRLRPPKGSRIESMKIEDRIVRLVGSVSRRDNEMKNASTDFPDVRAVFAFEAAADRQEEIQTEDWWWSAC